MLITHIQVDQILFSLALHHFDLMTLVKHFFFFFIDYVELKFSVACRCFFFYFFFKGGEHLSFFLSCVFNLCYGLKQMKDIS